MEKVMKKALSIMFALLLLFLLPACGGDEDDYDGDTPSGGDGGNGDNGGWESREDKSGKVLQTSISGIYAMAIGLDDNLYVGGAKREYSKKSDALLVAFDTKGKELWSKQWDYQESADSVNNIVTDKYGNIYVSGRSYDSFVIKFAPDGTKIWEQLPEFGNIFSLTLDSQQNVYISFKNEIIKYSTEGKKLQNYKISDANEIDDLAVDSEGNIYAVGDTYDSWFADNAGNVDAFLVKLAPDGTQLWGKQWGGKGEDWIGSIVFGKNGNIFVALELNSAANNSNDIEKMLLKISPDGNQMSEINRWCKIVTSCNDNNIYCVGKNQIDKYTSDGEYLGSSPEDEPYNNIGAITCDSKNNIYIVNRKNEENVIKISTSEIK